MIENAIFRLKNDFAFGDDGVSFVAALMFSFTIKNYLKNYSDVLNFNLEVTSYSTSIYIAIDITFNFNE